MVLSLAGVMAAPNMFASMTAVLNEIGVGNATGGGVFQAVTSDNGTFDTFCISINTEFSPGDTYSYTVSPTIVALSAPAGYPQNPPTYISYGTAYIYNQFELGNPTYAGTLNPTTANNMQYTIWYLQGLLNGYVDPRGYDYSSVLGGVTGTLAELETATGKSLSELMANGDGAFGVEAMNLIDGTDQPQLIQVPEATTMIAGALLLLPFGASAIRILRRNRIA